MMAPYLRPVDTKEFHDVCEKYSVTPFHVEEYCINRYRHKTTGAIIYLENHCECGQKDKCDMCYDFSVIELAHHPFHQRCRVCERLERFMQAQAEYWFRFKDTIINDPQYKYEFITQRDWSTIFGGLPRIQHDELELIMDTPASFLRETLYQNPRDKREKERRRRQRKRSGNNTQRKQE